MSVYVYVSPALKRVAVFEPKDIRMRDETALKKTQILPMQLQFYNY